MNINVYLECMRVVQLLAVVHSVDVFCAPFLSNFSI